MDCVEVLPLDNVLRRAERGVAQGRGAARSKIMGAPETPLLPKTIREQLERDEIGELLLRLAPAVNFWGAILIAIMSQKSPRNTRRSAGNDPNVAVEDP